MKKDGSRQSFDREKVLGGMIRACEKRPVPLARLEKVAAEIEQELQNLHEAVSESHRDFSHLEELLCTDFKSMYLELTPENRRAFWRSTIAQIYLNEDFTIKCVDFL